MIQPFYRHNHNQKEEYEEKIQKFLQNKEDY